MTASTSDMNNTAYPCRAVGYQSIHMTSQRTGFNETKAYSDNPHLPAYHINWGLPKLECLKRLCVMPRGDKFQACEGKEDDAENPIRQRSSHSIQGVAVMVQHTGRLIICDPEAEYGPLVERLHGQVIRISPTSPHFINPMDLNLNYSDEENPLSLKSDFILSLCELIVGGKEGLQPVEKTVIDRCVRLVYRDYLADPKPENMPILEDLYNALLKQDEKEAHYIATALEIYVTGSLNVFNHRTNVDIHSRIVSYDIKELGKQLKKIGMLIVQDQVWNRVTVNREARKSTR